MKFQYNSSQFEDFSELTPKDLALLLGMKPAVLRAWSISKSDFIKLFSVPKKSGGRRSLYAPIDEFRLMLCQLNLFLTALYRPKPSAHGFVKQRSILTNARLHLQRSWVLNVDLTDFFPTIHFGRIVGRLRAAPYFFPVDTARLIGNLVTVDGRLAQGFPTSPMVSNIICGSLDRELQKLALTHKCRYSRYANDITFSTRCNKFPDALATQSNGVVKPGETLSKLILSQGFEINLGKCRLRNAYNRQEVTGVIVNEKPNLHRKQILRLRALIHSWKKFGEERCQEVFAQKRARSGRIRKGRFRDSVLGTLNFLKFIKGEADPTYLRYAREIVSIDPSLKDRLLANTPLENLHRRYNALKGDGVEPQQRGYELERILYALFQLEGVQVERPFSRGKNAQIDGGFKLAGKHFIFECKWRKKVTCPEITVFQATVRKSGGDTFGLFLSITGFPSTWKDGLDKERLTVLLMDGEELELCLTGKITLSDAILTKFTELNFKTQPYHKIKMD